MLAVTATILLKGCAVTVIAPSNVEQPVDIFIIDYGRHPALVLPRSETELVEYSYGEWKWYAKNHNGVGDIFRALFIRSEGTLGRRAIAATYNGYAWHEYVPMENLHRLTVEQSLADELLRDLDEQWESSSDAAVYNHNHDLEMVPHPIRYSALMNCNTVLVQWLEILDCNVRGWPVYPLSWRVVNE